MTVKSVFILSICAALAGCGGSSAPALSSSTVLKSGGDKDEFNRFVDSLCDEITGGNTRIEFAAGETCPGCASESDANAVDGTDATFATLSFAELTQGPITYRATAQDGVVYPAGRLVGVVFSAPQNENTIQVVARTYLEGVEQERDCEQGVSFNESDRSVIGLEATRPFDALEVTLKRSNLEAVDTDCGIQVLSVSNPNQAVNPVRIRVHEFCHEFRLPN